MFFVTVPCIPWFTPGLAGLRQQERYLKLMNCHCLASS